ncbi:MAG TPA: hypothetical protein VHU81_19510 [Thermoanaerobaculia bacterium]|jgi:hypothetical protein|nr:hypothetical protein [Thermoanaerobaculia bacterium]
MRTLIRTILSLCLLFTFAGAATAQAPAWPDNNAMDTPDGQTPAIETICDGQTGAAHGLCNAYCEAMDCDSDAPQASEKACNKVGDNFTRITGQRPPCDVVCPCVAQYPGFIETLNGQNGTLLACIEGRLGPGSVTLQTSSGFWPQTAFFGPGGACGNALSFPLFGTAEETLVCANLIRAKAEAAGLTCM